MPPRKRGRGRGAPSRQTGGTAAESEPGAADSPSANSSSSSPPPAPAPPLTIQVPPPTLDLPSSLSSPLSSVGSPLFAKMAEPLPATLPPSSPSPTSLEIEAQLLQLPTPTKPTAPIPSTSTATATLPPSSAFSKTRVLFQSEMEKAVKHLSEKRVQGKPCSEEDFGLIVEQMIDAVGGRPDEEVIEDAWRKDTRRMVIDRGLEDALFELALHASDPEDAESYGLLCDVLDVILVFSEREYADPTLPLSCIGSLLDLQTIAGCQHIFNYIESRADRLLKDMHPQRGKGPLLLRLLNELLRRLPKSKTEDVIFSGRILMFLSDAFPLGEKSGVNLRGNFNTANGTVFEEKDGATEVMNIDDEEDGAEAEDFYSTFWTLQRFFTNPPSLFTPAPTTNPPTDFGTLKNCLTKTLDAFTVATRREKELSGAGKEKVTEIGGDIKMDSADDVMEHYFFPKFLTSRNLLKLEISDPAFRRQILIQILVLFQYLLAFTPAERAKVAGMKAKGQANSPSLPNYILSPTIEKWIVELKTKTLAEMESMEGGSQFRHTVELILDREQNWINWKLLQCLPFGKPPLPSSASTAAATKLQVLTKPGKAYMYQLGNPVLSTLWRRNTTSLKGCLPADGSSESFDVLLRQWTISNKTLKAKTDAKTRLADARPPPAGSTQKIAELDNEINELTIRTQALHWRTLREASRINLHLFRDVGVEEKPADVKESGRSAELVSGENDIKVFLAAMEKEEAAKNATEEKKAGGAEESEEDKIKVEGEGEMDDVEEANGMGEESEAAKLEEVFKSPKRLREDDDVDMKDAEESSSKKVKTDE